MLREPGPMVVTIEATVGASTEIPMDQFGGGSFHLPATSGTTQVTFYAQVGSVAYGIANDKNGTPIPSVSVTAGLPYCLPDAAYNYPRIKIVASAGTATTDVPVYRKS